MNKVKILCAVFLGLFSASYAQDPLSKEFSKLWKDPCDFFMYKESRSYCRDVKENGWNMRDFKKFIKTPTGRVFITYELAATVIQGYGLYRAYEYAKHNSAKVM